MIDLTPFCELPPTMMAFFWGWLAIWSTIYIYCCIKYDTKKFSSSLAVHDTHAVGMVILCALSLGIANEDVFSEMIPILFTLSYFIVDILDCLVRQDFMFMLHAILSIGICITTVSHPIHLQLRSVSQGGLTEFSTYPLHQWQRTKKRKDFLIFALLFTLCRIFWIPYFIYHIYIELDHTVDFQVIAGLGLFFLNFMWWFKIINIVLNYKETKTEKSE